MERQAGRAERTAQTSALATYFRSAETLFKLAEEFDERIDSRVLENSGDQPARTISLAELASRSAKVQRAAAPMKEKTLADRALA